MYGKLIDYNSYAELPISFEFWTSDIDERREDFEKYIADEINRELRDEYFVIGDRSYDDWVDSEIDRMRGK